MNIDKLIEKLQEYKEAHGNIEVRVASGHEYWGTLYNEIDEHTMRVDENTSLNPKRIENTKAVVFCAGYDV